MKITIEELKKIVRGAIDEAKKKAAEVAPTDQPKVMPQTTNAVTAPNLDFSKPLGDKNLYKQQGASNFGPYTEEKALRLFIQKIISESIGSIGSVGQQLPLGCQHIFGSNKKSGNIWETALNLTEAVCQKCGMKMQDEAHLGFKKLKGKLAHQKGVKDPAALAASIGRKKYGAKGMAKKAAAGRK